LEKIQPAAQAAMRCFATTVTIQHTGELNATSLTERTNPVTGEPSTMNVVFSPRYWAMRARRANFRSVVSKVAMLNGRGTRNCSRSIIEDIRELLRNNFGDVWPSSRGIRALARAPLARLLRGGGVMAVTTRRMPGGVNGTE
jgi:hypothetical protein